MTLPLVLDASVALVAEGYQSLGADWWRALEAAQGAGDEKPPDHDKPEKTEEQKVAENNAVLSNLMAGLGGSSFGGSAG